MKVQNRRRIHQGALVAALLVAGAAGITGVGIPHAFAADNDTSHAVQAGVMAHIVAKITAIDTDTNSVMLKGPRGNEVAVDVDPSVGNVSDLKVGDTVTIDYENALLLRADKVNSNGIRQKIETDATTPVSGGESTTVRMIEVVATVEKIDLKKRLVTLRGPERTVVLEASPDVPIQNLKVGDSIKADFKSAAAVKITRNGAPIK